MDTSPHTHQVTLKYGFGGARAIQYGDTRVWFAHWWNITDYWPSARKRAAVARATRLAIERHDRGSLAVRERAQRAYQARVRAEELNIPLGTVVNQHQASLPLLCDKYGTGNMYERHDAWGSDLLKKAA